MKSFIINHKNKSIPKDSLRYLLDNIIKGGNEKIITTNTIITIGDRHTGKTMGCLRLAYELLLKYPQNRLLFVSENYRALKDNFKLFEYIIDNDNLITHKSHNHIEFKNGSFIKFATFNKHEFLGAAFNGIFIDNIDLINQDQETENQLNWTLCFVKNPFKVMIGNTEYLSSSLLAKYLNFK